VLLCKRQESVLTRSRKLPLVDALPVTHQTMQLRKGIRASLPRAEEN
jgi:hypothetical protein